MERWKQWLPKLHECSHLHCCSWSGTRIYFYLRSEYFRALSCLQRLNSVKLLSSDLLALAAVLQVNGVNLISGSCDKRVSSSRRGNKSPVPPPCSPLLPFVPGGPVPSWKNKQLIECCLGKDPIITFYWVVWWVTGGYTVSVWKEPTEVADSWKDAMSSFPRKLPP